MQLGAIAELVSASIREEQAQIEILGVASLGEAQPGSVSFYANPRYAQALRRTRATAVLVPEDFSESIEAIPLRVSDPSAAFAKVLEAFAPAAVSYQSGIHPTAVIAPDAIIDPEASILAYAVIEAGAFVGKRTVVGAYGYIGRGAQIGEDCFFHPRVTVQERSKIGNRVVLHSGVVIGSDGFGYEFVQGRHAKIPQTGIVQIDDDVEIGANATIDRARFGRTWIQQGTKIDNLVQVAHNVTVGVHSILCAQVGIAGSTKIGNYVTIAGQAGLNGHIEVGDQAIITAMAGVTKDVLPKSVMVGLPAKPMKDYKTNYVLLHNIHKLYHRVKELEKN